MRKFQRRHAAWTELVLVGCVVSFALYLSAIRAQTPSHTGGQAQPSKRPIRITMEAVHRSGGVPPGWQFTVPEGDPAAGREVFVLMQCYACHTISGEQFPPVKPAERAPAPELTGVGALHPASYLAEAILNPSAVVIEGPGYADADGFSNMPNYTDILTVRQWLDLVAYLQSLRAPEGHQAPLGHQHTHPGASTAPPAGQHGQEKDRGR